MLKRTITAVCMLAVVAGMIVLGYFISHIFIDLLILLFGILGLFEMYKSFKTAGINMMAAPLIIISVTLYPVFYLLERYKGMGLQGMLISFLFSSLVALAVFTFDPKKNLNDLLATIFAMVYPFMFLATAYIISSKYSAIFAITYAILLPVACDTFAYWVGSTLKGKKLCPEISPKKTISGAVGGLLGALIASVGFFLFYEYFNVLPEVGYAPFTDTPWKSALIYLALGLIGGVVSQIGDIAASRIKRCIGIKDYGNIFPGHGGAMDRIDSIMFTLILLLTAFTIIY